MATCQNCIARFCQDIPEGIGSYRWFPFRALTAKEIKLEIVTKLAAGALPCDFFGSLGEGFWDFEFVAAWGPGKKRGFKMDSLIFDRFFGAFFFPFFKRLLFWEV